MTLHVIAVLHGDPCQSKTNNFWVIQEVRHIAIEILKATNSILYTVNMW